MKQLKKIGCVNAAIMANLQDCKGNVLGYTIDTPNAIAYAMAINAKVVKAVAHYALFGDTITLRDSVSDRFSWVVLDSAIHSKNLVWL